MSRSLLCFAPAVAGVAGVALGCTMTLGCTVAPDGAFLEVRQAVMQRTGQRIQWYRGGRHEPAIADEVRRLTSEPLSPATAIRLALINNRTLQAHFEDLGIYQADLVQAGMLSNPTIGGRVGFPVSGGATELQVDLGYEFLQIFTRAARERVAEQRLEAIKDGIAARVLTLIADVEQTCYALQAAQQVAALRRVAAEDAEGRRDLAQLEVRAGRLDALTAAEEEMAYESKRLAIVRSQDEVFSARHRLNMLLGLWGSAIYWKVEAPLLEIPRREVALQRLQTLAIKRRFDLAAARRHTRALVAALGLEHDWGWLGQSEAGVSVRKNSHGRLLVGPYAGLPLPIFDQGQARRARRQAELYRSYHELTALGTRIRAEVRLWRARLLTRRRVAEHYRDVLIPLRARITKMSVLSQVKPPAKTEGRAPLARAAHRAAHRAAQKGLEARRGYIYALRDYWVARSRLRRAVGGRLGKR